MCPALVTLQRFAIVEFYSGSISLFYKRCHVIIAAFRSISGIILLNSANISESKNSRKLLYNRFGPHRIYKDIGHTLVVQPCRNIIAQSQIARLLLHKLWEVARDLGMVVSFIQGL